MPYGAGKVSSGTFGTMAFQDADDVDITGGSISGLQFLQLGTISSFTGELRLANSASTNLTTLTAGNAAAARTYAWAPNFGAAGSILTDAAGDGVLSFSSNFQLAENASIKFDPALSTDGTYSGETIQGTLGETVAFGEMVYLKSADSKWWLTDADADATAGAVMVLCCVQAGAANDVSTLLVKGNVRADSKFPALTVGGPAYLSTTPGAVQTAQPNGTDDIIRIGGYGLTADELFFNPDNTYLTHV